MTVFCMKRTLGNMRLVNSELGLIKQKFDKNLLRNAVLTGIYYPVVIQFQYQNSKFSYFEK